MAHFGFSLCLWSVVSTVYVTVVSGQWCAPKLFEARRWNLRIAHTEQGPEIVESMSEITMDMIGNRLASHETGTRNGHPYSVFYLYYYPAGTLYTVKDGACTSSPIKGNVSIPCFSWDNRHVVAYLTKNWVGDYENGVSLVGDVWYEHGIGSLLAMDVEGAIPMFEGKSGELVRGGKDVVIFAKEYIGTMGQGNGWVWNVGGIAVSPKGVTTIISMDGEDAKPLFEGKSGVLGGGTHVVASLIKEWIGVEKNVAWNFGSVTYYQEVGALYTFDVEGAIPMFEGKEAAIDGGKHVVAFFAKDFLGDRVERSPILGSVTYDRGMGSLYSFDIEGGMPLFEGKDGVIDEVPTYTLSSYTNVTLGIRDPSVFTPPSNCIQATEPTESPLFRHSLLGL